MLNSIYEQSYRDEIYDLHALETESVADCVHILIEELYESSTAICEKRIDAAMYRLAELSKLNEERLDCRLSVKHVAAKKDLYEWHAGYTRALVDLSTHKKTVGA